MWRLGVGAPMKLRYLTCTDFRGFARAHLEFSPEVTVLVGVNGAGKSSVLDAIAVSLGNVADVMLQRPMVVPTMRPMGIRRGTSSAAIEAGLLFGTVLSTVESTAEETGSSAIGGHTVNSQPMVSDVSARPAQCLGIYFRSGRNASLDLSVRWKEGAPDATTTFDAIDGALAGNSATDHDLFRWFRDREDFENAEKVRLASLAWADPQLDAVRAAVTAMLPGFTGLRVDRGALRMVVDKEGNPFFLDQLSDGERNLIALAADVARRLAIANPGRPDPLRAEVVVLIDEIELRLHPGLQRQVMPRLRSAFPNAQFVVSTHSPQVLSSVSGSDVRVLEQFEVRPLQRETWRRDTNRILEAAFGDRLRDEDRSSRPGLRDPFAGPELEEPLRLVRRRSALLLRGGDLRLSPTPGRPAGGRAAPRRRRARGR